MRDAFMTKLSTITQIKREADELVALAHILWEICRDKYDAHGVVDADRSWHFTGPTNVLNNVIAS